MLDIDFYRHMYPDLDDLDDADLERHWNEVGVKNGRVGTREQLLEALGDLASDLPEGFDWREYVGVNPGLEKYGWNGLQAAEHYVRHGRGEGRPVSLRQRAEEKGLDLRRVPEDFDWRGYLRLNPDVAQAGFTSREMATLHYVEHGIGRAQRIYRFDHEFYADYYLRASPSDDGSVEVRHWRDLGWGIGWHATVQAWLDSLGVAEKSLPAGLSFDFIRQANDRERFSYRDLARVITQEDDADLRIYPEDQDSARFWRLLSDRAALTGDDELARKLAQRSLGYDESHHAYQRMGDASLRLGEWRQAAERYGIALDKGHRSVWPAAHIARLELRAKRPERAVAAARRLIRDHPDSSVAKGAVVDVANGLWDAIQPDMQELAARDDRDGLVDLVGRTVETQAELRREWVMHGTSGRPRATIRRDRVLIIGDMGMSQTKRYRIDQKREQLLHAGYDVTCIHWGHTDAARQALPWHDVVIFYRAPAWPDVIRLIEDARATGKVTFYEIDDMVFDVDFPPHVSTYGGLVEAQQYVDLMTGMAAYRAAAQLCDYGIASTRPLVDRLAELTRTGTVYLHRNGADSLTPANQPKPPKGKDEIINIFYGSGTKAHNADFVELVLPALERLLAADPRVHLVTVGYLVLPETFIERFGDQIRQLPMTGAVETYMALLQGADINLAVLQPDVLTDGKSELKWFEAANFGIPSVVSDTANYLDVVVDGEDCFVARTSEEWHEKLLALVESQEERRRMGEAARRRVAEEYSVPTLSKNIAQVIEEACDDLERRHGRTVVASSEVQNRG